jgi:hypothetical protein
MVPNAFTGIFLHIMDTEKVLAERIRVRILGHTGRILRSYLHDLYDHDIQTYYRGGRGLKIFFLRALFSCFNTKNCRVLSEGFRSIVNQRFSYGCEQESQDLI